MKEKDSKILETKISYILSLFPGSTTIQWVRKFFLNTNEMVESPSQGVKMFGI